MKTLHYHLIDPYWRKNVDLRDYAKEMEKAVEKFPVSLDEVKSDELQLTILADKKKNSVVRGVGREWAKTSLKSYAREKKGKRKSNELFREKKIKMK